MSLSFNIDGSNLIRNLLQTYEWQKAGLQSNAPSSSRSTFNILYSRTAYPPQNILSQFIDEGWQDFQQRIRNLKRIQPSEKLYNYKGNLTNVGSQSSNSEPLLFSLWTKDEVGFFDGNIAKLEAWMKGRMRESEIPNSTLSLLDDSSKDEIVNTVSEDQVKLSAGTNFNVVVD